MVSGGGTNLQAIMDACQIGTIDGEVVLVISSSPKAYALERAKNHGIPAVCIPKSDFDTMDECNQARHNALIAAKPDLIVLAGFLGIVPAMTVSMFKNRIINTHPALIPEFCGKGFYGHHVHEAVIASGILESGATIHFVEEGVDTGPIIFQEKVPVLPQDTPETLAARVLAVELQLLPKAVALFCQDKIHVQGQSVIID